MNALPFGQKLLRLREEHRTKQADLAEAVGTNERQIQRWEGRTEKGAPSELLSRIARYFGVDANWLADDDAGWPPVPRDPVVEAEVLKAVRLLGPEESFRRLLQADALARENPREDQGPRFVPAKKPTLADNPRNNDPGKRKAMPR